jgi:branched-chain amino acid transport system permease protein
MVPAVVLTALALVPLAASLFHYPYLVTLFNRAVIYALAAMALDLVMGFGRLVSFGHGAFFGLGGYVVAILGSHAFMGEAVAFGWTGSNEALLVWPLAMAVAGVYAAVVGLISLRTSGVQFIMITLAFGQLVYFFFVSLSEYGGQDGLSIWERNTIGGLPLESRTTFYFVCLAIFVAAWVLLSRVVNSRFGRVLQGCRQNERRMRALGYRTFPYKLVAFVISGALAGLAGALIANHTEFVSPALMHWTRSGQLMVIVLLGGLCSLIGPLYGALLLLLMEEVLVSFTEHWQILLGPVLVLAVLFFRGGIHGALGGRRMSQ